MFANPDKPVRAQIERGVRLILDRIFDLPSGRLEENFALGIRLREDLGADSLEIADLVMGVEEHFDCVIPDDAPAPKTVRDLVDLAEKALKAQEATDG